MTKAADGTDVMAPPLDVCAISPERLGPGSLVLVVGPSGAGKDTLLDRARARLRLYSDRGSGLGSDLDDRAGYAPHSDEDGPIRFVRRLITRPAQSGGEAHREIDEATFNRLVACGDYALGWRAHGLGYLLPSSVDEGIAAGLTMVANGSRRIFQLAANRYENLYIVNITAPIDILAERLAARGRESRADIKARLARSVEDLPTTGHVFHIVNDRTVEEGAEALLAVLKKAAHNRQ